MWVEHLVLDGLHVDSISELESLGVIRTRGNDFGTLSIDVNEEHVQYDAVQRLIAEHVMADRFKYMQITTRLSRLLGAVERPA